MMMNSSRTRRDDELMHVSGEFVIVALWDFFSFSFRLSVLIFIC